MLTLLGKCCSILLAVPFIVLGVEIWVKYPYNHGGGLGVYIALGAFAFLANLFYMAFVKRFAVFRIVSVAVFALLLYACDRFNIYVSYGKWIERGMPEWGAVE